MSDTNKASPATLKKRNRRGRPALLKNTFKLSTKELLSMPKKIQKYSFAATNSFPTAIIKGYLKHTTDATDLIFTRAQKIFRK